MSLLEIPPPAFLPDAIRQLDYYWFFQINGRWHTPFFDTLFPLIREPTVWVPFYFFLILFVLINFKMRGLYWIPFFIGLASFSDYLSSTVIKGNFFRLRPCHDPSIAHHIRFLVSYCPVSSSFTSSHAVNHFAAAMFIFTTFRKAISSKWALIFIWSFAISYAQIYVGVHFPFDVFCGILLGLLLGYIPAKIFNTRLGLMPKRN